MAFGLYIHIPFCRNICHYCDFSKTARFDGELVKKYFSVLKRDLCGYLATQDQNEPIFTSVNFGGGTPGLFGREYEDLLAAVSPFLLDDSEVSLEVNPNNISSECLEIWRKIGFNRLSIGVQTFDSKGLEYMRRDHSSVEAIYAIEQAKKYFDNINLDLIYGWQGQTKESFTQDLHRVADLEPDHVSAYALTMAPGTPIGRRALRTGNGVHEDEHFRWCYEQLRNRLSRAGFLHDEVSNWSKPHKSCGHNWLYWSDGHYLGLGLGASGYVFSPSQPIGYRYINDRHLRSFAHRTQSIDFEALLGGDAVEHLHIEKRDSESHLFETVGSGLRTCKGVDLNHIHAVSGYTFEPQKEVIKQAFAEGVLCLHDGHLKLSANEWLRETAWCLQVLDCFSLNS